MPRQPRFLGESHKASDQVRGESEPRGGYKIGGKVSSYPKVASSNDGRVQKVRSYQKGKP